MSMQLANRFTPLPQDLRCPSDSQDNTSHLHPAEKEPRGTGKVSGYMGRADDCARNSDLLWKMLKVLKASQCDPL